MEKPDIGPGTISQEGVELLDCDDIEELDTIEAENSSNLSKCCTKIFNLWLRKQPSASWNQLIEALRQPDIDLGTLATKIEQMLLQPKPKEPHKPPTAVKPQFTLVSVANLKADFASLLLTITRILSNCPNQQTNLQKCKDYCLLNLKVSDSSNDSIFSAQKIDKIKECGSFKQLIEIISEYTSWDEHSILTHIALECESDKGQEEIEKFDKKLGMYEGLKMIACESSKQSFSEDFIKLCIIINKPYKSVTMKEYENVKAYICSNLKIIPSVISSFFMMLYHSLHIEWLVTVQAVSHMIKIAHQNKDLFIKEKFVYMQIGSEVVINDEDTLTRLLSKKQLENLKIKQRMQSTESNEESYACKKISSDETIHTMDYFKPNTVVDEFSCVTEQVAKLLQSYNPKLLVEQCETILASDHIHDIKLFSDEQLQQLHNYKDTPSLLQELGHLWSWSNHSMLRVLVGFCGKAIELLDNFDSRLDLFEPITAYPLFEIIPSDVTTRATLSVKFVKCAQILLQDVFNMCSLLINKCGVTRYCLQLIAAQYVQGLDTIYWSIPKCVASLISCKSLQFISSLYDEGVLEITIYPDNVVHPDELRKVVNDLFLEIKEKDALLSQYDREKQQLQVEIHDQRVYMQSKPAEFTGISVDSGVELQSVKEKISDHFSASEKVELKEGDISLESNVWQGQCSMVSRLEDIEDLQMQLRDRGLNPEMVPELKESVKVELKKGDISLEPNVWQGQSTIVSRLEEDIEDLQMQLRERGLNPEMVPESKGSVKLPSYASASKDVDVLTFHDVVIHKELGSGNYGMKYQVSSDEMLMVGSVLHEQLLPTGEKLCKMIEQFKSDCFLAVKLHHPHVIEYFGICNKAPYKFPMLLQEFIEENLDLFLERTKNTLTFSHKLRFGLDMASGLEYLHVHLIVHKSLNASNVLIDKNGQAKISDFVTPQLDNVQFSSQNNSVYIAPEIFRNSNYFSCESDVFSLGILSLYLFTTVTITAEKLQDIIEDIKYRPLKRLICSCISNNVMDRPNAGQVCRQIVEIQNCPTAVAYEALTSQNPIDFTDAMISGRYTIRWSNCKPLDLPTWWAHAVTIGQKVYVCGGNSAGTQSDDVFVYHLLENTWRTLPQPGVYYAVPVSIKDKLTVVGGQDTTMFKFSAKLLTFDDSAQQWIKQFPDLLTARSRPGVVVCSHYLIVAGGKLKSKGRFSNDIEFLNLEEFPLRWKKSAVKLPTNMWDLTIFSCENYFWIVGYEDDRRRRFVNKILTTDVVSSAPSAKK